MEKYQDFRDKARKAVHVADHMLTMSYPLLNDPKILVSVAKNLNQGVMYAIDSALEHEKLFKRIPAFHDSPDEKIRIFREKIIQRYNLNHNYYKLAVTLKELMHVHRNSTVEFPRGEKFVMASENYEMRTITIKELKNYIIEAKLLVDEVQRLTSQNDGIFR